MKIKIPSKLNPWLAMETHSNPTLMKRLLKLRRKKNEEK